MAQITVLSTKTQKKYTLNVQGTTLADLKAALDNNQIDYNGMTFFEGRTKTELLTNESTFPENAVIRLTKSEKKITSGAELTSRADCQTYLKAHPEVAETIKKKEGKNWTNCGTAVLLKYCCADAKKSATAEAPKADAPKKEEKPAVTATKECKCDCADLEAWVSMGLEKGFITEAEAVQLRNTTKVEGLSQSDLDMFKGF